MTKENVYLLNSEEKNKYNDYFRNSYLELLETFGAHLNYFYKKKFWTLFGTFEQ